MGINLSVLGGFLATFKRPLVLCIETTNKCNADCTMCSRNKLFRKEEVMSFQMFEKIVLDAKKNGIKLFQLSFYGEPLLDDKIVEKVKYIKSNIEGSWIKIVTNASLLTQEKSIALLEAGISEIRISIEGNNKEEYEKIRKN